MPILVLLAASTGCQNYDPRISLQEFLLLDQQFKKEAAPSEEQVQNARKVVSERLGPYKVGPLDTLQVDFSVLGADGGLQALRVRVDRDGAVKMPTVGNVPVSGLTIEDVEDKIQEAYVPDVYQDVSIYAQLVEADTTDVVVRGAAVEPGLMQLRNSERNLLYAIVAAGGVTQSASGKVTLRRLRQPDEHVTLDLSKPEGLSAALALDPLEDGDLVFVHAARPNTVFVGGLVNLPAPQTYPPGVDMTVLQILAAAGGTREYLTPTEATLVRRMPDGQDVRVKLNLQRLRSGEDPNILMAAGDILWVPHTTLTYVEDFINRNIFLRAGVVVNYNIEAFEDLHSGNDSRFPQTAQQTYDPFGFLLP